MLHFIQSDSTVSFNFILALRRYSKSFTHLHLHWFHTAKLHEICCPGLSSRSEMVLFLFICCAYAWDFFLTFVCFCACASSKPDWIFSMSKKKKVNQKMKFSQIHDVRLLWLDVHAVVRSGSSQQNCSTYVLWPESATYQRLYSQAQASSKTMQKKRATSMTICPICEHNPSK